MLASALFLVACTADSDDPLVPTGLVDTDVVDTDATDTGLLDTDVDDTDPPAPYRPQTQDCPELPPLPTTFTSVNGVGPHEDFTFDRNGRLVGIDGTGSLRAETRDGDVQLLSPGVGEAKGTRFLPDNSVVVALPAIGTVDRISIGGGQVLHAGVPAANGIAIDLHGNAWIATMNGTIERIAMDGTRTVVVDSGLSYDGIALSPDDRLLYFNSEFGNIYRMPLSDDGEPAGPHEFFANIPVNFAVLDGMTTDMCGNLYTSRMDGRVYRILPDGTVDGFIDFTNHPGPIVIPAINFGPGVGGFERDHLYAMNFLGGVVEADIGIDGRWESHFDIPTEDQ
jgi:sugar lactone lactonase YvrE